MHDSENASVEGCLDDGFEVLGMDGLVVVDMVGGRAVVGDNAIGDFVQGCTGLGDVSSERC